MKNRVPFLDRHKKQTDIPKAKVNPVKPTLSSAPKQIMDQSQFNYEYSQFTLDLPINQQVKENINYLYDLYYKVCSHGGLVQATANNKLTNVIFQLSSKYPQIASLTVANVLEHYIKFYLFSFEIVLKLGQKIENDKLINLLLPRFIEGVELRKYLTNYQQGVKLFDQDITVLRSVCSQLGLSYDLFNTEKMKQKCMNDTIKVMVQDVDYSQLDGYENIQLNQNTSDRHQVLGFEKFKDFVAGMGDIQNLIQGQQTIHLNFYEFVEYFKNYPHPTQQERNQILKQRYYLGNPNMEKVLYVHQFDPQSQLFTNELYQKIKDTILENKQEYDLLSYADEDILGVTIPIFSIQVNGSWSGGKIEPYGMARVHINFGPDQIEWYCISAENVQKFYNAFKTEYAINIQKLEGEWFQNIDWFITRKVPVKKIIQSKGDGLIIGSGSLSWQKSKGKSLQCSWNIMPKSQKQIIAIANRCSKFKQSSLYTQNRQSKVPIKGILLRVLNHQQYDMRAQKQEEKNKQIPLRISPSSLIIIRQCLKKWYNEEEKFLNQMIIRQQLNGVQYRICHLFDGESQCSFCQSQILNYFAVSNGLNCLQCLSKKFMNKKSIKLDQKSIFCKYDPYWTYQLIYYGNNRKVYHQSSYKIFIETQELCIGQYIGIVSTCCKLNQKKPSKFELFQNQKQWEIQINNANLNYDEQFQFQNRHYSVVLSFINKKMNKTELQYVQNCDQRFKHCNTQTILSLLNDQQLGIQRQPIKQSLLDQAKILANLFAEQQRSKYKTSNRKKNRGKNNESEREESDYSQDQSKTTIEGKNRYNTDKSIERKSTWKQRDYTCKVQCNLYDSQQQKYQQNERRGRKDDQNMRNRDGRDSYYSRKQRESHNKRKNQSRYQQRPSQKLSENPSKQVEIRKGRREYFQEGNRRQFQRNKYY